MNVWHICIVNHLWKKVKRFYSLYGLSLGMICTKQGASIQAIHSHVSVCTFLHPAILLLRKTHLISV